VLNLLKLVLVFVIKVFLFTLLVFIMFLAFDCIMEGLFGLIIYLFQKMIFTFLKIPDRVNFPDFLIFLNDYFYLGNENRLTLIQ
jgi:hypothetical protein